MKNYKKCSQRQVFMTDGQTDGQSDPSELSFFERDTHRT